MSKGKGVRLYTWGTMTYHIKERDFNLFWSGEWFIKHRHCLERLMKIDDGVKIIKSRLAMAGELRRHGAKEDDVKRIIRGVFDDEPSPTIHR